ncbi:class I SAM-dependent methyltransferase [Halarcobacter anaerophilus]|uniref:Methyltransferase n=1 Tax=Halarcobacter anaerophilus TaxID=877500 RepID=A0A4Q0XYM9_9BACT|nr:class I SAM-dependent methyltransferase [Halarcobacter anaerophilus]QDF30236.1 SAM-dependent methyltransferase [Halarcobacter anaerophilus]RXJ62205.1 hypothetical protein CRV06_10590 [Halarcobacter anaerophilus]
MGIEWKKIDSVKNNNQELVEVRKCPICGNKTYKSFFKIENFQFFSDSNISKQVDINNVQCDNCLAVFMNPCYSKKGFPILFEEAGMSYGSSEGRPNEQVTWLKNRKLLNKEVRVLDIGCGSGNFLSCLPLDVAKVGVDIDKTSIDLAKEKYENIEFICSSFEDLNYQEDIDLITMYHVLEHLSNPKEVLIRLNDLSNENTKLLIEVPIIENGLTNDINGFFSVQHLTHFSRNSFKNILQLSGWEIVEWQEQKDYNGCRVLAQKGLKLDFANIESDNELINLYKYLSNWYKSLEDVENKIIKLEKKRYVIWGAGMHLEFLYQTTSLFKRDKDFIIIDSDKNKYNKTWRGIHIYPPEFLEELEKNSSIVVSSYGSQYRIEKYIKDKRDDVEVIKLYDYLKVY